MAKLPELEKYLLYKRHYGVRAKTKHGTPPADGLTKAQAAEIIHRVEAYNPWIPVSERLPEKPIKAITLWESGNIIVVKDFGKKQYRGVTHWMPIVLPGENDGKEKEDS